MVVETTLRLHSTLKFQVLGFAHEHQVSNVIQRATKISSSKQEEQFQTHDCDDKAIIDNTTTNRTISIFLDVDEPYTRLAIQSAFAARKTQYRVGLGPGKGMEAIPLPPTFDFQWAEYERIDWDAVLAGKHGASSYCIRKGLCRKAQLAFYTHRHVCKHPNSILKTAIPQTIIVDTWAAWSDDQMNGAGTATTTTTTSNVVTSGNARELADIIVIGATTGNQGGNVNRRVVLDQCLAEAKTSMIKAEEEYEQNGGMEPVWILKPSTINKGSGIQIIHLYEQLVDICWTQSNVREWVLQQYVSPPLLLKRRKFHIRAYALAVGALQVYLSRDSLALCSGTRYRKNDTDNLFSHITNTAFQDLDPNFVEEDCIYVWSEDSIAPILLHDKTCHTKKEAAGKIQSVLEQMERITSELFHAYQNEFGVFSPIEGCFEHYGLDFLVNDQWEVFLLEVNPGPDFKQTGDRLGPVIETLMGDTIDVALSPLVVKHPPESTGKLRLVYDHKVRGSSNSFTNKISMKLT